jgi:hypothetical protein
MAVLENRLNKAFHHSPLLHCNIHNTMKDKTGLIIVGT